MLKQINEELYEQFMDELEAANEQQNEGFKRLAACLAVIRKNLQTLKANLKQYPFSDKEEEIHFFKLVKPRFYQWQIYYIERNALETSKPLQGLKQTVRFYEEQLKFISRFFHQSQFHYQYYQLGASELDNLYFLRGTEVQPVLIPEVPEVDPSFSTGMDYLFAKFMAYEKLQEFLVDRINGSNHANQADPSAPLQKDGTLIKWTGDKTNLVEIIYGLFYTGQLNNGNASVADIIKWMETHLQIDLSRAYRSFLDIRMRKRDSHTRFLDAMRESISQRVDEDNQYKPNRGIHLRGNNEK